MPKSDLIRNPTWQEILTVLSDPTIQVGLAGPPGVGKTSAAYWAGNKMKKKIIRKIQFHSEMSPAEALGMYVPGEKRFKFIEGPAIECYRQGGLLILDEIDQASGPMKTCLYSLLDRGPGGTVNYVGQEFRQEEGYQPVATMNGWPTDGSLPEPVLDRFDCWLIIDRPSEQQLKMLEPDLRKYCRNSYEAASDSMLGPSLTFRMFLALQKLRRRLEIEQAVLACCYGNTTLARSLLEVLAVDSEVDDDTEADDDEEEDEDPEADDTEEDEEDEYDEEDDDSDDEDDDE